MLMQVSSELIDKLAGCGPQRLYQAAARQGPAAYITGMDETLVTLGIARKIPVHRGFRSLDPLDDLHYEPELNKIIETPGVVVAALPFDRSEPFELDVPQIAVMFYADKTIEITLDGIDQRSALNLLETLSCTALDIAMALDQLSHYPSENDSRFEARIRSALAEIRDSRFEKVVLSRTLEVKLASCSSLAVFAKLAQAYPSAFLFSLDRYVGASPEIVLCKSGDSVSSHPLAGTANLEDTEKLLLSVKDHDEHQIVVEQITEKLQEFGILVNRHANPGIARFGPLVHLASDITANIGQSRTLSSLNIVSHLAPTPAINGSPYESALEYIRSHDGPRGLYGGVVGYQKNNGDGAWSLNIRSVRIDGGILTFRAGVGIVGRSDPQAETAEAAAKLNSIVQSVFADHR